MICWIAMIMADLLVPFIGLYDLYKSFQKPKPPQKVFKNPLYFDKNDEIYTGTPFGGYQTLYTKKYGIKRYFFG